MFMAPSPAAWARDPKHATIEVLNFTCQPGRDESKVNPQFRCQFFGFFLPMGGLTIKNEPESFVVAINTAEPRQRSTKTVNCLPV
jgi:hypothetical protein